MKLDISLKLWLVLGGVMGVGTEKRETTFARVLSLPRASPAAVRDVKAGTSYKMEGISISSRLLLGPFELSYIKAFRYPK